jgi:hypothetical protein
MSSIGSKISSFADQIEIRDFDPRNGGLGYKRFWFGPRRGGSPRNPG